MSDRRAFLRAIAAGGGVALAGCNGIIGSSGPTATDTSERTRSDRQRTRSDRPRTSSVRASGTPVKTATTSVADSSTAETNASGTGTTETDAAETTATETHRSSTRTDESNLAYYSPGSDLDRYDELVRTRKRAALRTLLGVSEVGDLVTNAVSTTAYHRILEGMDFIEILAPDTMTVTPRKHGPPDEDGNPTYEPYQPDAFEIAPVYDVTFDKIRQIRGLVGRETGTLQRLDVRKDIDRLDIGENSHSRTYRWDYPSNAGYDLRPAKLSLQNDRVREIVSGKDWYVSSTAVEPPYTGFSEKYPLGSLSVAWFNWNDREGNHVAVHTVVDIDNEEVLEIAPPKRPTPQPLLGIVKNVEGKTSLDGVARGPITPPGTMGLSEKWIDDFDKSYADAHGTIQRHDWSVKWHNTTHNAYRIEADYKGKPVFGRSTLVPFMFSDYAPFGTVGPGVPTGKEITYQFWDPLGSTGPGVVERHDFADGFRIRGTFHSGSSDRWEWRLGQNFGPYRYIVDWSFYADGRVMLTVRFPTTGYRTTNGYPKYSFHVALEPGFETATASAFDDSSWSSVATESRFERAKTPKLRVENANGPERVVFEHPGDRSLLLQYDADLVEYEQSAAGLQHQLRDHQQYLEFDKYLRGNSIDGEHLQIRTLSSQDTGEGPYATVDPFMFRFVLRAENY